MQMLEAVVIWIARMFVAEVFFASIGADQYGEHDMHPDTPMNAQIALHQIEMSTPAGNAFLEKMTERTGMDKDTVIAHLMFLSMGLDTNLNPGEYNG
jgi:hypothetical protein